MTYELPFDDAYEPYHASSPTDRVILELQMYGHRPHQDEPDPRPLPDDEVIRAGLAGIVETFAGMLGDTRLEPDLDDLLWSFTNVFHRAADGSMERPHLLRPARRPLRLEGGGRLRRNSSCRIARARATANVIVWFQREMGERQDGASADSWQHGCAGRWLACGSGGCVDPDRG